MSLGGKAKENRLKENLAFKTSKHRRGSIEIEEDSSSSGSDCFEYDYSNLSDSIVQFIMVEYSDGMYNTNWLKFYSKNL